MFNLDTRGEVRRILGKGYDGIYADAWGRQKVVMDFSIVHGVFTYDIPDKKWIEYNDGVEVPKTNCTSVNGTLKVESNGTTTTLMSRRHPRYQPNRGHLYSTSMFLDNTHSTNGKMYAVVRTLVNGEVIEVEREASNIRDTDYSKGNIYDIQMQWRGVGNFFFYINQKEIASFDYLGKLSQLSISNPALPIQFLATNQKLEFGMFTNTDGAFYRWVFNTPQETSLRCGCVDVSSEGGNLEKLEFVSVIGNELTVSDAPILAIRIPETYKGRINTRDIKLARIKVSATKRSTTKLYLTRDTTALTINTGTWQPVNGGNMEAFSPLLATDSTFNETKAQLIDVQVCEPNVENINDNPIPLQIDFFLVHGDYLVLTGEGSVVDMRAIIELGEEL